MLLQKISQFSFSHLLCSSFVSVMLRGVYSKLLLNFSVMLRKKPIHIMYLRRMIFKHTFSELDSQSTHFPSLVFKTHTFSKFDFHRAIDLIFFCFICGVGKVLPDVRRALYRCLCLSFVYLVSIQ